MHAYYTFLALDIANERAAEADAYRLAALAQREPRTMGLRRAIARIAFAVARAADDEVGRAPLATH